MALFNRDALPRAISFIVLFLCLSLAPSPVYLAESEQSDAEWDCHVERVVFNAGGKVHAEHQASSNAEYPHVSGLKTDDVNIELYFTEGMDLGSFHGTTVKVRDKGTGKTLNITFSGKDSDNDGHPEQIVVDVEGPLQKDNHYMLIVNGRDMAESDHAAVWGAPHLSDNPVMRYSLHLDFDTKSDSYAEPAADTDIRTFFNP